MNNRGNLNLGEEIRNIVQDAVNNRDFNRLNRDIGNVVNGALDEVRRSMNGKRSNHQPWNIPGNNNNWDNSTWKPNDYQNNHTNHQQKNKNKGYQQQGNHQYYQNNYNSYNYRPGYDQNKPMIRPMKYTVPVGQVSGTLLSVFGTIGATASVIAAMVLAVIGYFLGNGLFHIILLILLPFFILCTILTSNGGRIRKRLKRYQRYVSQMNGRNYCLLKDLSSVTGRSMKYTVKDLQKMIEIGMFPEGHIDDQKTCFMLNNDSYKQYLELQKNMKIRDLEQQTKQQEQTMKQNNGMNQEKAMQEENKTPSDHKMDKLEPVIRKAIEEGRQYVLKIKNANIAIPGEEISRKLDRLEEVTGKIYDYVELHPEKFPEIKKFTEYFLPTTLKLLDAYKELEHQPVVGENISTAKKEIEDTMDTINTAFENLLDGLFEDAAMDISTDISVLQTILAQEGLTGQNVRNMK